MNKVVILAAGKGKRMGWEIPKILVPVKWKPMIHHLIGSVIESWVDSNPTIVVSRDNIGIMQDSLKEYNCNFVLQEEQLWTGHALFCTKVSVNPEVKKIICLYGDHPFIKPETLQRIKNNQSSNLNIITTKVQNFEWRFNNFYHWWRIIRDWNGIKEIVEFKDASSEQKEIMELNSAIYSFDSTWLWQNIDKIKNTNNQKEYYLTDLIKMAFEQNINIDSFHIDPTEAIWINSREELEVVEKMILECKN